MDLNAYQFDWVKERNNLARMVIQHEYPLSMVDHIAFREFVSSLQPLFKFISRNTLKSDIIKIYDNEREKALKMTDKNGSRMSITTDMWTSSNKKKGFMVITAHFIQSNLDIEKPGFKVIFFYLWMLNLLNHMNWVYDIVLNWMLKTLCLECF